MKKILLTFSLFICQLCFISALDIAVEYDLYRYDPNLSSSVDYVEYSLFDDEYMFNSSLFLFLGFSNKFSTSFKVTSLSSFVPFVSSVNNINYVFNAIELSFSIKNWKTKYIRKSLYGEIYCKSDTLFDSEGTSVYDQHIEAYTIFDTLYLFDLIDLIYDDKNFVFDFDIGLIHLEKSGVYEAVVDVKDHFWGVGSRIAMKKLPGFWFIELPNGGYIDLFQYSVEVGLAFSEKKYTTIGDPKRSVYFKAIGVPSIELFLPIGENITFSLTGSCTIGFDLSGEPRNFNPNIFTTGLLGSISYRNF